MALQRQAVFNMEGALVRKPIVYQDVLERGLIDANEDPFTLNWITVKAQNSAPYFRRSQQNNLDC